MPTRANISLRPAREGDGEHIIELFGRTMRPGLRPYTMYGAKGAANFLEDLMVSNRAFSEQDFFVATRGDDIVGAVEVNRMASYLFINHIYIDSSIQGMGVGGRLMRFAIGRVRDRRHYALRLDAEEGNDRAYQWYQRLGLTASRKYTLWKCDIGEARGSAAHCTMTVDDPDIQDQYERYDFCEFELRTPTDLYFVGLLGSEYYKSVDADLVADPEALAALRQWNPNRRLILAGDPPKHINTKSWEQIATFHRLEGPINTVLRYLQDK